MSSVGGDPDWTLEITAAYGVTSLTDVARAIIARLAPLQLGNHVAAAVAVLEELARDSATMEILSSNLPPPPDALLRAAAVAQRLDPPIGAPTLTSFVVADVIRALREARRPRS